MRKYEESIDQYISEDKYIVVRLDGRSFTRLTKRVCKFKVPFDEKFRDLMTDTVKSLMESGFKIVYGYTESDEISLLFHPSEDTFSRKVRKINTTLAGEASAAFSLNIGQIATFDSRVVPLPDKKRVGDYFRWRQEDSLRNALQGYCYWTLRMKEKLHLRLPESLTVKVLSLKKIFWLKRALILTVSQTGKDMGVASTLKKLKEKDSTQLKTKK